MHLREGGAGARPTEHACTVQGDAAAVRPSIRLRCWRILATNLYAR